MTEREVERWIDAYVEAWRTYESIGDLFAEDATYRYHPFDEPLRGREAIVASWLEDPDEPGSWNASYAPLLVDGDRAVITGESRYVEGITFSNLWMLRFDDHGRCADFVEWYMEHPTT